MPQHGKVFKISNYFPVAEVQCLVLKRATAVLQQLFTDLKRGKYIENKRKQNFQFQSTVNTNCCTQLLTDSFKQLVLNLKEKQNQRYLTHYENQEDFPKVLGSLKNTQRNVRNGSPQSKCLTAWEMYLIYTQT